jgi:hypothetical protein
LLGDFILIGYNNSPSLNPFRNRSVRRPLHVIDHDDSLRPFGRLQIQTDLAQRRPHRVESVRGIIQGRRIPLTLPRRIGGDVARDSQAAVRQIQTNIELSCDSALSMTGRSSGNSAPNSFIVVPSASSPASVDRKIRHIGGKVSMQQPEHARILPAKAQPLNFLGRPDEERPSKHQP